MIHQQPSPNQQPDLSTQISKAAQVIKSIKAQKQTKSQTNKNHKFLIGVCGIPGAGKSTIAHLLVQIIEKSVILPMDGFHIMRHKLTEEGIKRRGAAFTFDCNKFAQKIQTIKLNQTGTTITWPDFDHKLKDPVEDAISIGPNTQVLIVQGLYVFDQNLKFSTLPSSQIWDFKIWIDADIQASVQRVAKRHLQSGIEPNYLLSYQRANSNDYCNAQYVVQNCYNVAEFKDVGGEGVTDAVIIRNSKNINIQK